MAETDTPGSEQTPAKAIHPFAVRVGEDGTVALAANEQTIALAPAEQLALHTALNAPVELTAAQKQLGRLMRGES